MERQVLVLARFAGRLLVSALPRIRLHGSVMAVAGIKNISDLYYNASLEASNFLGIFYKGNNFRRQLKKVCNDVELDFPTLFKPLINTFTPLYSGRKFCERKLSRKGHELFSWVLQPEKNKITLEPTEATSRYNELLEWA